MTGLWVGRSFTLPSYGTVDSTGASRKAHHTVRGKASEGGLCWPFSFFVAFTLSTDNFEDQKDKRQTVSLNGRGFWGLDSSCSLLTSPHFLCCPSQMHC